MERLQLGDLSLAADQAELLLDVAELAIRSKLKGGHYPGPDVDQLPERLRHPCGAFVTLHVRGALNGCIGNIESDEPLGACVAKLAVQAAFEDHRLPQLTEVDLADLEIEISLLSPRSSVPARTRAELLNRIVPCNDGLIISSGRHRAVFLPSVWEQLPQPGDFIDQLLLKAGLPVDRWPADMQAEVFTTISFARRLTADRS